MNVVLALTGMFLMRLLGRVAEKLFEKLMEKVFELVGWAEKKWRESEQGALRRDEVVKLATQWLTERVDMNWIQRWMARIFVGQAVDLIIDELNNADEELGHNWIEGLEQFEEDLRKRLGLRPKPV